MIWSLGPNGLSLVSVSTEDKATAAAELPDGLAVHLVFGVISKRST